MTPAHTGAPSDVSAGANPTPMTVNEGFFNQPVQAYFQFVQNNLTYIIQVTLTHSDVKLRKGTHRSWNKRFSNCTKSLSKFVLVRLPNIAEAERRHEQMTAEYTVSRTAAEHEVTKLRKELSDANTKLKNAANAAALEAEQRANQKVAHLATQYEQRYSELRGSLEADCKRIVDDTVEYARKCMEGFKKEEQAVIQEMREECSRQESPAAELNFQLQEQVQELMEKLNEYSAPEIKIDEVCNDDDGLGGINLDLYMTPKSVGTKAGAEPKPSSGMDGLAADAKEKLSNLFATTPAGSAAPPKLPPLPVQRPPHKEANSEPSVRSPTVVASEPDKRGSETGLGLSGQQLVDLITRLTSKNSDGEKPRTKEAETIKLNDMPTPEAYRHWRNLSGTKSSHAPTSPMRLGFGSFEVFDNKTPRDQLEEKLQDPAKFITLDTKLSAALTRSAKGDLATKIHNFKDEKSKNGIQVRGRRVLLMFEDYFRTSEKAGSLYRVEDLLGVICTGESVEGLRMFLNRWDATIAGMETPPDDLVLRDILLRQIRKCQLMKYDIEALTELSKSQSRSPMHSYSETSEIF